jgi:hypothetical protein
MERLETVAASPHNENRKRTAPGDMEPLLAPRRHMDCALVAREQGSATGFCPITVKSMTTAATFVASATPN